MSTWKSMHHKTSQPSFSYTHTFKLNFSNYSFLRNKTFTEARYRNKRTHIRLNHTLTRLKVPRKNGPSNFPRAFSMWSKAAPKTNQPHSITSPGGWWRGRKMERKKAIEGHGIKNLPASPIPSSWKEEITGLPNEPVYDNSSSANSFLAGSYISIINQ